VKNIKTFNEFVNEQVNERTFNDIYKKKDKWVKMLDPSKRQEIAKNLFWLVQNSYGPLGGHPSIPDISGIFNPKLYYWEASDNDKDPEANVVIFGRKTDAGVKISGMGHDKSRKSKGELVAKLKEQLKKKGYWIEASDKVEVILYNDTIPYVDSQETVEKLFGQKVEWLNDKGRYKREVSPKKFHIETVFGRPNA
jgi:hypothetical protein